MHANYDKAYGVLSFAKSNHQVGWDVVGVKVRCRNDLIMKSSVGGWLLIVHVSINDRFCLLIWKQFRNNHKH